MNLRNFIKILVESSVVGILTVISGFLVSMVIRFLMPSDLPIVCKEWNKNHVMEISLFFTGFALHIFLDIIGINKWYCKSGNTCLHSTRK